MKGGARAGQLPAVGGVVLHPSEMVGVMSCTYIGNQVGLGTHRIGLTKIWTAGQADTCFYNILPGTFF